MNSSFRKAKTGLLAFFVMLLSLSMVVGCAQQQSSEQSSDDTTSATTQEQEDIQYVLYVGTNDKDTNQPVYSKEESKQKAKDILIKSFGGYTIQDADGGWVDDNGTEYQEYTMIIYLSDTSEDAVHEVCDTFIKVFNQSSILIQANETKTEFYAGK